MFSKEINKNVFNSKILKKKILYSTEKAILLNSSVNITFLVFSSNTWERNQIIFNKQKSMIVIRIVRILDERYFICEPDNWLYFKNILHACVLNFIKDAYNFIF